MKRLLCIVGSMNAGGAETFLMKIYRIIDKSKYQMDFCVSKKEKGFYDDEIINLGGKIIYTSPKSKNLFKSFNSIKKIVKNNDYKYVLRVSQHSLSALELAASKLGGAKVLAFRSSNTKTMKDGLELILHKIFMFAPKIFANVKIAPSSPAAEFMFGKKNVKDGKVHLLNNGIPLEKFKYSENIRNIKRKELGIDKDTIVVGHVGRFTIQKNHKKLLEVFSSMLKKKANLCLLLIGEGELKEEIFKYSKHLNINDKIKFLGVRDDVSKLLSAMDIFVFPSLYEGMPNTVIEAEANGLPCIISDTITEEAKITKNVLFLSLKENSEKWAKIALENINNRDMNTYEELKKNGYDINDVVSNFINLILEKDE